MMSVSTPTRVVGRGGTVRWKGAWYSAPELNNLEGCKVGVLPGDDVGSLLLEVAPGRSITAHRSDDPPAVFMPRSPSPTGKGPGDAAQPAGADGSSLHYLNLRDANVINTEDVLYTETEVRLTLEARAMSVFWGEAGVGKTTAVGIALAGTPHTNVVFTSKPTLLQTASRLYEAATGNAATGNRYAVEGRLCDALTEDQVITIDEAQLLQRDCLHQLRQLHDRPETRFTLIFVGGPECYANLAGDPMLASRLYVCHEFRTLSETDVLQSIPGYHPIYARAPPEMLLEINDKFAHGLWRAWAKFTLAAARECTRRGIETPDASVINFVRTILSP